MYNEQMNRMTIPSINFQNVFINQNIDFFSYKSMKLTFFIAVLVFFLIA